jgi:hypothetical protein
MLLTFTDANTDLALAVNPEHVVCVFVAKDDKDPTIEKTIINMLNGNVIVKEDYLSVVGQVQGALK